MRNWKRLDFPRTSSTHSRKQEFSFIRRTQTMTFQYLRKIAARKQIILPKPHIVRCCFSHNRSWDDHRRNTSDDSRLKMKSFRVVIYREKMVFINRMTKRFPPPWQRHEQRLEVAPLEAESSWEKFLANSNSGNSCETSWNSAFQFKEMNSSEAVLTRASQKDLQQLINQHW